MLQPETSRFICRILARRLISIVRQPVLIAASRCYLIQMHTMDNDLRKRLFLLVTGREE
jgi:hypothetical protein